jgi:hypothetical protein
MAKSKAVFTATTVAFSSLKDSAYQQAGAAQTLEDVAHYALENIAGFPKDLPDEAKEELVAGYRMKYNQMKPATTYAVINGHYVLPTAEQMENKTIEHVSIGVEYAFSYSSQEFGKLKNTNPALHELVAKVREATSTYCSNRLKDLKVAATKILNAGKERQRTANKDFAEFVELFFKDTAPTRMKSAKARGDSSADEKRWTDAKVAFMVQWNK